MKNYNIKKIYSLERESYSFLNFLCDIFLELIIGLNLFYARERIRTVERTKRPDFPHFFSAGFCLQKSALSLVGLTTPQPVLARKDSRGIHASLCSACVLYARMDYNLVLGFVSTALYDRLDLEKVNKVLLIL